MGALVIKSWRAENKPIDANQNFVSITGRKSGLVAWLLSLLKIDPSTTINVGLDRVEFTSASLAGTASRLIPLQGVCSTYYGYHKPWKQAVSIFMLFAFFGFSVAKIVAERGSPSDGGMSFVVTIAAGFVIALVYYFLNRTLTLGFVEHSGVVSGIVFKRSVIENLDINHGQAKAVCLIIQRLIELKERRTHQASAAAMA